MFDIFANVIRVGIAIVAAPVAAVADIATMPASAYYDKPVFKSTSAVLQATGAGVMAAISSEKRQ